MANETTEQDELYALVQKAVAEQAEKDGITEKTAIPQKYDVNIDGKNYPFETPEARDAALTQLATTFRTQLEEAKKTPVAENKGYVSGKDNEPQFEDEKYIDLMHKNIPEAQKYALDHIFGPNAVEEIKKSISRTKELESTVAVFRFKEDHPEIDVKNPAVTNIIEGIRKELGQGFTKEGLEASLGVAYSRGLLPSPQVLAYQQSLIKQGILTEGGDPASTGNRGQAATSGLGFQPPPSVSRSNPALTGNFEQLIEDMPLDQLEKILRQKNLL